MKAKSILLILAVFFVLGTTVSFVYAHPWAAIENSGYAVTQYDPLHGTIVIVNTDVTVRAGTTHYEDENVKTVTFRWMPPEDSGLPEVLHPNIPLSTNIVDYTRDEDPIHDAFDSLTITATGDWGVQAWFHDSQGNIRHRTDIAAIRATSFHSVPEAPYGTIATLLGMLGSLGVLVLAKGKIGISKLR